ncbi:MAG: GAF domain-containing protein [Anaerolineae bacterium]|nr:GAF domain-containing protein [Anaerolineae bacterium]
MKNPDKFFLTIERTLPWIVFVVLITFSYAKLFEVPYAGFVFHPVDGSITQLLLQPPPENSLQLDDRLVQIGNVSWLDFKSDLKQEFFEGSQPGEIVQITVERAGETLTIPWEYPGINQRELVARIYSEWWLAYIFWIAGLVTLLFVRPKDSRWQLLAAFNFLTAIWLAAGSGLSGSHVWYSAIVLRSAVWLCLPVYLHLHWVFPKPLKRLPSFLWWGIYLLGIVLAVSEWFQLLPASTYYSGFLLAITGSLLFLVLHAVFQSAQRRDMRLLAIATALALTPSMGISVAYLFTTLPAIVEGGALLALPIIPGAYFYTLFRRQLGGLEFRANRLISLYLFIIIFSTALLILIPISYNHFELAGESIVLTIGAAMVAALVAVMTFNPFERFVERRILGIPLPPTELIQTYSTQITTRLQTESLIELLTQKILASLLIRQSALVTFEMTQPCSILYTLDIDQTQIPTREDIPYLNGQLSQYRSPLLVEENEENRFPWIRVALPLRIGEELIGMWFLGRRDPDDFYSQAEIRVLQTLANQTAIALTNIYQAQRLHTLYQADIDRQEVERASLARDLHDEVLNQLGAMFVTLEEQPSSEKIEKNYQLLTGHLRQIIHGLRPAMLSYGLRAALTELADDLNERSSGKVKFQVEIPVSESDGRIDANAEQHLFRIVQQACENALNHAQATLVKIHGMVDHQIVQLVIEDNGTGFSADQNLDFESLLAKKHYGLAGMHERALLIGAKIKIDSQVNQGTTINLNWSSGEPVA